MRGGGGGLETVESSIVTVLLYIPFCFSITDFSLCPPGPLAIPYIS